MDILVSHIKVKVSSDQSVNWIFRGTCIKLIGSGHGLEGRSVMLPRGKIGKKVKTESKKGEDEEIKEGTSTDNIVNGYHHSEEEEKRSLGSILMNNRKKSRPKISAASRKKKKPKMDVMKVNS
uniref:Uncharacterized protein LOC111119616 isoform X1 n=1 Tax=Crassostrea virginica TaxID=6565 RepID=A0A8B8CKF3_CRAVI|nr:uncharacterized protein LOC111119616 isoform X1 [Crassostrea virginica]